mgnify:CR=1 FL=1
MRAFESAVFLVALFDLVKQRGFLDRVRSTEGLGSLEHQVLKIVSQTSGLMRIVARTGADSDVGLDTWLFLVYGKVNFQAMVMLKAVPKCIGSPFTVVYL